MDSELLDLSDDDNYATMFGDYPAADTLSPHPQETLDNICFDGSAGGTAPFPNCSAINDREPELHQPHLDLNIQVPADSNRNNPYRDRSPLSGGAFHATHVRDYTTASSPFGLRDLSEAQLDLPWFDSLQAQIDTTHRVDAEPTNELVSNEDSYYLGEHVLPAGVVDESAYSSPDFDRRMESRFGESPFMDDAIHSGASQYHTLLNHPHLPLPRAAYTTHPTSSSFQSYAHLATQYQQALLGRMTPTGGVLEAQLPSGYPAGAGRSNRTGNKVQHGTTASNASDGVDVSQPATSRRQRRPIKHGASHPKGAVPNNHSFDRSHSKRRLMTSRGHRGHRNAEHVDVQELGDYPELQQIPRQQFFNMQFEKQYPLWDTRATEPSDDSVGKCRIIDNSHSLAAATVCNAAQDLPQQYVHGLRIHVEASWDTPAEPLEQDIQFPAFNVPDSNAFWGRLLEADSVQPASNADTFTRNEQPPASTYHATSYPPSHHDCPQYPAPHHPAIHQPATHQNVPQYRSPHLPPSHQPAAAASFIPPSTRIWLLRKLPRTFDPTQTHPAPLPIPASGKIHITVDPVSHTFRGVENILHEEFGHTNTPFQHKMWKEFQDFKMEVVRCFDANQDAAPLQGPLSLGNKLKLKKLIQRWEFDYKLIEQFCGGRKKGEVGGGRVLGGLSRKEAMWALVCVMRDQWKHNLQERTYADFTRSCW